MEDQCSSLAWALCNDEDESVEEVKQSLLFTSLELQRTILTAREEISKKEDELMQLKEMLQKTTQERDVAISRCQSLVLEKMILQQRQLPASPPSKTFLPSYPSPSSDSGESTVTPTGWNSPSSVQFRNPLPEKGKLLKAVVEAGPLLQTLLLAGPLPQWHRPPPLLDGVDIPLIVGNSQLPEPCFPSSGDVCFSTKRSTNVISSEDPSFCKYQRLAY